MARWLVVFWVLSSLVVPVYGAEHWISASTAHFEMYTPAGERQAEAALQTFEQVYYFFGQKMNGRVQLDERVRIIAFQSEKNFKPFRPNEGTFAFYQQGQARDYIVMQDIEKEHARAAVHEYTHLVVRHMGMDLPVWLDEGLAELYSSLEPEGKESALVGRPLPSAVQLQDQKWIDWDTLLRVDHKSPFYNEKDKMSVFYPQSWLLTHMLDLSPTYHDGFSKFLLAILNGTPSAEAFQKVYGKSVHDVGQDARNYFQQRTVQAAVIPIRLSKQDLDVDVQPLPDFQRDLAFGELKAESEKGFAEGRGMLQQIAKSHPDLVEVHEALGYAALRGQDQMAAGEEFGQAARLGSRNADLYTRLAELDLQAHRSTDDVIAALQKALELEPGNDNVRLFLASVLTQAGKYSQALAAVAPIRHLKPEQAYGYYSAMTFCHAKLKDPTGARQLAEKAATFAKTDEQKRQADELLNWVTQMDHSRPQPPDAADTDAAK